MTTIKLLTQIKKSSLELAQTNNSKKNNFLKTLGKILSQKEKEILNANKKDIDSVKRKNLSKAFIDRLKLDEDEIGKIIQSLKNIEKLDDPIGRIIEKKRLANGLLLQKLSVPLGVILVIYESRPDVTIDVAALCIKSGNCAVLKGGSEALNTNKALYNCILRALEKTNLPRQSVTLLAKKDDVAKLLKQNKYIDLVIARGGYEMVKRVQNMSKIPVLAHSAGGARIYVDKSADLKIAKELILNAKISKPAACNSVDTVLVHKNIAKEFIPLLTRQLKSSGVEVRWNGWETEFLDLIVTIKIVEDVDEAIKFINKYTKKHTEGIIAQDKEVINKFINGIDAASIMVNCSTRLHDGGIFGMGAEAGIATGKLHARGPVGLRNLTSYKWVVQGNGQIRE